jgi:hypothetical protein
LVIIAIASDEGDCLDGKADFDSVDIGIFEEVGGDQKLLVQQRIFEGWKGELAGE